VNVLNIRTILIMSLRVVRIENINAIESANIADGGG
jgi:hypothetical protein